MRKAFCDRCGKEIEEDRKTLVDNLCDFVKCFVSSRSNIEPVLFFDEVNLPKYPAELCQECQFDLKKWFEEGAKK